MDYNINFEERDGNNMGYDSIYNDIIDNLN